MKRLFTLLLLAPALLFAQSPFDGTWMTKLDTAQFPKTNLASATKPSRSSLV